MAVREALSTIPSNHYTLHIEPANQDHGVITRLRGVDEDRCPMDIVEEDAELVILQLGKGATEELRGKPHLLIGDLRYWLHQVITGNIRESVGLSKSGEVVKSLLKAGPANDEQRLMTRELMRRTVTTVEFRYKPY